MTTDELQTMASLLRWCGLAITGLGVVLTFGSHLVADKLLVVQRADKAKAEARLKASETTLAETTEKAEALEKRVNVIQTLEIRCVLDIATTSQPPTSRRVNGGMFADVALITENGTVFGFDSGISHGDQQLNKRVRRLTIDFTPASKELYGKPITSLTEVSTATFSFAQILQGLRIPVDGPSVFNLEVALNGIVVGAIRNELFDVPAFSHTNQRGRIPVQKIFKHIPTAYAEGLEAKGIR